MIIPSTVRRFSAKRGRQAAFTATLSRSMIAFEEVYLCIVGFERGNFMNDVLIFSTKYIEFFSLVKALAKTMLFLFVIFHSIGLLFCFLTLHLPLFLLCSHIYAAFWD